MHALSNTFMFQFPFSRCFSTHVPLTHTHTHPGALFSIIATTSVFATVVAAVVVYFFYPLTLKLGWAAGTVYFLMAVIALIPVPFVV